jgi:hypothetical protein
MKKLAITVILSSIALAPGCTPSPEKVCDKGMELFEKSDLAKDMKDKDKAKFKTDCLKDETKLKEKDADAYKAQAKCVMDSKDLDDVIKCDDKKKKKKSADDDDDTGKKKKKKAADDE